MKKTLCIMAVVIFLYSCRKSYLPDPKSNENEIVSSARGGSGSGGGEAATGVTVTTGIINGNSAIQASASGSVTATNKYTITERGFCYSSTPGPTINNDTARAGSGTGSFNTILRGLSPGSTYYGKAYAKISTGTVYYGSQLSFTTCTIGMPGPGIGTVNDIDGNVYNTITYGTQVWMVENLKTTRFNDGTPIPKPATSSDWMFTTTAAYCDYNNNPSISNEYGRLYNWYAANDSRIAPPGWHVASSQEWNTLLNFLGGYEIAGGRMKEAGLTHWMAPNIAGDNSSQFTGVGGGFRGSSFSDLNSKCYMFAKNPSGVTLVQLHTNSASHFISSGGSQTNGFSIRLVKNN